MTTTPCSSCGQPMLFVKTEKGKMMPLDQEPCEDGNIILINGIAHYAKKTDMFDAAEPRYKSHFASCPHGPSHRKKP